MLDQLRNILSKSIFGLPILVIGLLVIGRLAFGGFSFSHFVVAGSDFVDSTQVESNFIVVKGQGYDGQFFYRLAHNPIDTSRTAYGVTIDHIEYRIQRIVYPSLVWVASLGGQNDLVPFGLVLINCLALIGILILSLRIGNHFGADKILTLLPLFLFGAFMALARDTSEVVEVFLFLLAIYFLIVKENLFWFLVCTTCTLFTREASVVAIAPILGLTAIQKTRSNKFSFKLIIQLIALILPLVAIAIWRFSLHQIIASESLTSTHQNLAIPFSGIIYGATNNFNFDTAKNTFESIFWFSFMFWNLWLVLLVMQQVNLKNIFKGELISLLSASYIGWVAFSVVLGPGIYIDDWAYVRVFTLWNMIGFLILMLRNKPINMPFTLCSSVLLCMLLFRLVIRV